MSRTKFWTFDGKSDDKIPKEGQVTFIQNILQNPDRYIHFNGIISSISEDSCQISGIGQLQRYVQNKKVVLIGDIINGQLFNEATIRYEDDSELKGVFDGSDLYTGNYELKSANGDYKRLRYEQGEIAQVYEQRTGGVYFKYSRKIGKNFIGEKDEAGSNFQGSFDTDLRPHGRCIVRCREEISEGIYQHGVLFKRLSIKSRDRKVNFMEGDEITGYFATIEQRSLKYLGQIRDLKFNGSGIIKYNNGDQLDGYFINDQAEGICMASFSSGISYKAQYVNGVLTKKFSQENKSKNEVWKFENGDQCTGYTGSYSCQGYVYQGEMNNQGLAHGKGVRKYKTAIVEGSFFNGMKHGVVKMINTEAQEFVEARFEGDVEKVLIAKYHDKTYIQNDESGSHVFTYTGQLDKNWQPHGKGTKQCFVAGHEYKYTGLFVHGVMDSQVCEYCCQLNSQDVVYNGSIVRDGDEGIGLIGAETYEFYNKKLSQAVNNDFWSFVGECDEGGRPTKGRVTFKKNKYLQRFIGVIDELVEYVLAGEGELFYFDRLFARITAKGRFANSALQCANGTQTFPNLVEAGSFTAGKLNGKGRITHNSGEVFEGEFTNGSKNGVAVVTLPSGFKMTLRFEHGTLVERLSTKDTETGEFWSRTDGNEKTGYQGVRQTPTVKETGGFDQDLQLHGKVKVETTAGWFEAVYEHGARTQLIQSHVNGVDATELVGTDAAGYKGKLQTKQYTYIGMLDSELKENGKGTRTYPEETQQGEYRNGLRNGKIKRTVKNGWQLEEYCEDKLTKWLEGEVGGIVYKLKVQEHGKGYSGTKKTKQFVYDGQLDSNGQMNGYGVKKLADGTTIAARWVNELEDGLVETTKQNGDFWKEIYSNGTLVEKVSIKIGRTEWKYIQGNVNEKQKAQIWDPEFEYEGEVDDEGRRSGVGTTKFTNGTIYEGFLDAMQRMHDPDAKFLYEGYWFRGGIFKDRDSGSGVYKGVAATWSQGKLKWNEPK